MSRERVFSLTDKLRQLYILDDKLPKLIDSTSVPTQNIKDYYVQPELVSVNKDTEEKHSIELKDIFVDEGRILLEGGFGVGKTVILKKISNAWGVGELFSDNFDYVFKIRLNLLLNWIKDPRIADVEGNKLAHFIFYNLPKLKYSALKEYKEEYKIKFQEIEEIIEHGDRSRILLLLDGDNNVAPLLKDEESEQFIYDILTFPNIVMSSRTSSLPSIFMNEFDLKVEVVGFTPSDAKQYISKYFYHQMNLMTAQVEAFFLREGSQARKKDLLDYLSRQKREHVEIYEISVQLKKIDNFFLKRLGENQEEIQQSVVRYYQESEVLLKALLDDPNIKDILENPTVTSMVCLVFSDPDSRKEFTEDLTISKLYEEFIIWLSRKYLSDQGENIEEITREMVLASKELMALKEIAFEATKNNNVIQGEEIDKIARKHGLDISTIYKLGLLKITTYAPESDRNTLIVNKHSFIRTSVQDYLSASLLKEKLKSHKEEDFKEAAEFIAEHRNQTKYLMILKFIAEMITKDPDAGIELIRFWEAVTCNIDGTLELGTEMKVTLLMHLMARAHIGEEFDPRIPNVKAIIDFIDEIILDDLLRWGDVIKASGYISEKIKANIWSRWYKLDEEAEIVIEVPDSEGSSSPNRKKYSFKELKGYTSHVISDITMLVNIIMSSINKLDNAVLLANLELKLENKDWQIKKVALKLISHLAVRSGKEFLPEKIQQLIQKIIIYIPDDDLEDSAIDALVSLIKISGHNEELILEVLKNVLPFVQNKDVCEGLVKLINKIILNSHEGMITEILEIFKGIYKDVSQLEVINPSLKEIDYSTDLFEEFDYSSSVVTQKLSEELERVINKGGLDSIIELVLGVAKSGIKIIIEKLLDNFIEELQSPQDRNEAAYVILNIAKGEEEYLNLALDKLTGPLREIEESKDTIIVLISNILKNTKVKINTEIAYNLIEILEPLLRDPHKADIIAAILGELILSIEDMPALRREALLESLFSAATDKENIYQAIVKSAINGEEVVGKAVDTLIEISFASTNQATHFGISAELSKIAASKYSAEMESILMAKLIAAFLRDTNKIIYIIPIAHLIAKDVIIESQLEEIIDGFISLLFSPDQHTRERVAYALNRCESGKDWVKEKFFVRLEKILKEESPTDIQLTRIFEIINKFAYKIEGNRDLLTVLWSRFESIDHEILAHTMGNIAQVDVDLSLDILFNLITKLKEKGSVNTLHSIEAIVQKDIIDASMLGDLLETICLCLEDRKLKARAVYVLNKIVKKEGVVLEDHNALLTKLASFLKKGDIELQKVAISTMGIIIEKEGIGAHLLVSMFNNFAKLLHNQVLSSLASEAISFIIREMSLSDVIRLLVNNDQEIRSVAVSFLSKEILVERGWEQKVELLLNILAQKDYENDTEVKKLHEVTRKFLQKHVEVATEEELLLTTTNFDKFVKISEFDFESMALKMYHVALSDRVITETESHFAVKCITAFGFTNVIYKPKTNKDGVKEFKILFDNILYVFYGDENIENIGYITRALMQSYDMLASQYRTHIPLFPNTGSGIKIAASDIKDCRSLVSDQLLSADKCQISLLCLSDHHKEAPSKVFVILEERILGLYVIYKIYLREGKINSFHKVMHPIEMLSAKVREEIFTSMNCQDTIPMYYGQTWELDAKLGEQVIRKLFKAKKALLATAVIDEFDEKTSELEDSPRDVERVVSLELILMDDLVDQETTVLPIGSIFRPIMSSSSSWENSSPNSGQKIPNYHQLVQFIRGIVPTELLSLVGVWEVDSLVATPFGSRELLKRDDAVDEMRIKDHELVREHELSIKAIQDKLKNIDLEILHSLINKERLSIQAQQELDRIKTDPYQYALYKAIVWQLNAIYIAVSAISSKMVGNVDQGLAGKIGGFLSAISAHTPLIGMGVKIVSEVCQGIEDFQAGIRISNYVDMASNSNDFAIFADKIARSIVVSNFRIIDKKSIAGTLESVVDSANQVMSLSVANVISASCQEFHDRIEIASASGDDQGLSEYVARFAQARQLELTPKARGEKEAAIAVKVITKHIFAGSYEGQDPDVMINKMLGDIMLEATEHVEVVAGKGGYDCCGCIVMKVTFDEQPNIEMKYDYVLGRYTLDTTRKKELKAIEEVTQVTNLFNRFVEAAKLFLDESQIRLLKIIGKKEDDAQQILSAAEERGIKPVLSDLFNLKQKEAEPDSNNNYNILEYIEKFTQIVFEGPNFNQYIDIIIFKRGFYSQYERLIKKIVDFNDAIEDLLDKEAWYEFLGIDTSSLITINWLQLNGLLEELGSAAGSLGMPFRPSGDPFGGSSGGGGGGGSSGGSYYQGQKNNQNDTQDNIWMYSGVSLTKENTTEPYNNGYVLSFIKFLGENRDKLDEEDPNAS